MLSGPERFSAKANRKPFELPRGCRVMSYAAEQYRRKAREAEALAKAARDQTAKETYLETAERWRRLAEQAEGNNW
jgi:hypothetical protein